MATTVFRRAYGATLRARLHEPRRFLQVVTGSRQVGKTTLARQVLGPWGPRGRMASADEPTLRDRGWLAQQWEAARTLARESGPAGAVFALDEIQKVPGWSETVKRLWDEDTATGARLRVVLLGPAPLLAQQGLTESLAGRFEVLHLPHWSFSEMREAFGFDLERYFFFGGYPGAASLASDPPRWARYIKDSLIETTISRDVLLLARVDKPALLRQLFALACRYSGQIVSYTKMVGQLPDAGNTTTLAHYLELLSAAGMVTGLQKYSGSVVRQRGSSPRLQVLNTALITAQMGIAPGPITTDRHTRARLLESSVGAHLANAAAAGECEVFYWRDRHREVDFILRRGDALAAIEVKRGQAPARDGVAAFTREHRGTRALLVGGDGVPVEEFLDRPVIDWVS